MSDHSSELHIVPVKVYAVVFASLLLLTGITVAVARLDLGALNVAAAISIAILKSTLVILYFMHVRYSSHLVKVFVCAGFLWFVIMIVLTISDYMTRGWLGTPRGWQ
jgi:cytochrome c oxidase subunit IV